MFLKGLKLIKILEKWVNLLSKPSSASCIKIPLFLFIAALTNVIIMLNFINLRNVYW